MSFQRLKAFAETRADKIVKESIEFSHPFDVIAMAPQNIEQKNKLKLWSFGICALFFLSGIGRISELNPKSVAIGFFISCASLLLGLLSYWFCTHFVNLLRSAAHEAKRTISEDAELKKELIEINRIYKSDNAKSTQNSAKHAEVKKLQDDLNKALFLAANRESFGDFAGAGIARADAAVIESKLRSLGA